MAEVDDLSTQLMAAGKPNQNQGTSKARHTHRRGRQGQAGKQVGEVPPCWAGSPGALLRRLLGAALPRFRRHRSTRGRPLLAMGELYSGGYRGHREHER